MINISFTLVCMIYFSWKAHAIDPFEGGFFRFNCMKDRKISGCIVETLSQAYLKTDAAKSDEIFSEPETRAYLFTRDNRNNPEPLHECGGRLPSDTVYRAEQNTQILISGYLSSICTTSYLQEIKEQLLYRENYNVIIIDWSWGQQLDYYSAVRNAQVVGKQTAFLIRNIMDQKGITGDKFHLIGHSLGAHVAGRAGAELKGILRRITGLDPASPAFKNTSSINRLDSSDAKIVDVIHSNGGKCFPKAFGYKDPCGHADFYPNGGEIQCSSWSTIIPRLLIGDLISAFACIYPPLCYHLQSAEYFKVSINTCRLYFIGVECNSYEHFNPGDCRSCGANGSKCAVMGMDYEYYPRPEGNHIYFLDTSFYCPFIDNSGINQQGFPETPVTGDKGPHCFNPNF